MRGGCSQRFNCMPLAQFKEKRTSYMRQTIIAAAVLLLHCVHGLLQFPLPTHATLSLECIIQHLLMPFVLFSIVTFNLNFVSICW